MARGSLVAVAIGVLMALAWGPGREAAAGSQKPEPGKQGPTDPTPLSYEGENLAVNGSTATDGTISIQQMAGFGKSWSNNAQALWTPTKVGAALSWTLLVGMNRDALYTFRFAFTKAPDYGRIQLTLNGKPVGAPFDGYAPQVTHAGLVTLGSATLLKVPVWNQFQFVVAGRNPKSTGFYMGLDKITMEPTGALRIAPAKDLLPGSILKGFLDK